MRRLLETNQDRPLALYPQRASPDILGYPFDILALLSAAETVDLVMILVSKSKSRTTQQITFKQEAAGI